MGWDLYSPNDVALEPNSLTLIDFGIKMELPDGHGAFLKDRSSMAENKIHIFSGVMDNGYRGNVSVFLYNFSDKSYHINQGDRIAQMVPLLYADSSTQILEVDDVSNTNRGKGAFGSTGK